MLARHLQQSLIIKKIPGRKQKSPKSDQMFFRWHCTGFFSCTMFSGFSWATLKRVFTCVMLPQEYYSNIEQDFFLCNVVWSLLDNIAQGVNSYKELLDSIVQGFVMCSVAWSLSNNIAQGFYLCNIGPWLTNNFSWQIPLRQHCTKKLLVQCWPRPHAQKNNPQFCLDLSGSTLHKAITCGMLAHG